MKTKRTRRAGSYRRLAELDKEHQPVQADWKFWAHHVLHWHLLLLAVAAILYVGYSASGNI